MGFLTSVVPLDPLLATSKRWETTHKWSHNPIRFFTVKTPGAKVCFGIGPGSVSIWLNKGREGLATDPQTDKLSKWFGIQLDSG